MKFPGQGEAVSSRELFLDDGSLHGAVRLVATIHYAAKLGRLPQGRARMPLAEKSSVTISKRSVIPGPVPVVGLCGSS